MKAAATMAGDWQSGTLHAGCLKGSERLALLSKMYSNGCVQRRSLGESVLISHRHRHQVPCRDRQSPATSSVLLSRRAEPHTCKKTLRDVSEPNSQDFIGGSTRDSTPDVAVCQQSAPCEPHGGRNHARRTKDVHWQWCAVEPKYHPSPRYE